MTQNFNVTNYPAAQQAADARLLGMSLTFRLYCQQSNMNLGQPKAEQNQRTLHTQKDTYLQNYTDNGKHWQFETQHEATRPFESPFASNQVSPQLAPQSPPDNVNTDSYIDEDESYLRHLRTFQPTSKHESSAQFGISETIYSDDQISNGDTVMDVSSKSSSNLPETQKLPPLLKFESSDAEGQDDFRFPSVKTRQSFGPRDDDDKPNTPFFQYQNTKVRQLETEQHLVGQQIGDFKSFAQLVASDATSCYLPLTETNLERITNGDCSLVQTDYRHDPDLFSNHQTLLETKEEILECFMARTSDGSRLASVQQTTTGSDSKSQSTENLVSHSDNLTTKLRKIKSKQPPKSKTSSKSLPTEMEQKLEQEQELEPEQVVAKQSSISPKSGTKLRKANRSKRIQKGTQLKNLPNKRKTSQFAAKALNEVSSTISDASPKNQPQSVLVFKQVGVEQEHKLSDVIETEAQAARNDKIRRFWKKKHTTKQTKKYTYKYRKEVAQKRLRIEGRFVTKQQAFDILGMDESDFINNDKVQSLLTMHSNEKQRFNSFIQNEKKGGQIVKVQNFQALIDNSYSIYSDNRLKREGKVGVSEEVENAPNACNQAKLHCVNLRLGQTNEITTNHLFNSQLSAYNEPIFYEVFEISRNCSH